MDAKQPDEWCWVIFSFLMDGREGTIGSEHIKYLCLLNLLRLSLDYAYHTLDCPCAILYDRVVQIPQTEIICTQYVYLVQCTVQIGVHYCVRVL